MRWSSVQVVRMHPDEAAISNIPRNDPANDRRCSDDEYWPIGMINCHGHSTTALVRWMGAGMRYCRRGYRECDRGGIAKARGSPPIARLIIVCSHLKFRPLELLCRIRRFSRRGWHVTCSVAARATPMGFPGGVFVAVGLPGVCHGGPGAACPRGARGEATGRSYSPLKLGHY